MSDLIALDLIVLFIFILIFFVPIILYEKLGWFKGFYHDVLGWHKPIDEKYFDGYNTHSCCKYCGKEIMQDSQGNWF